MRFMVMVKASRETEAGALPTAQQLAEMGKFNEELVKAGVMLAGEGLQASSKGARVKFSGKKRTVVDGPFAETKELIAGFWIWRTKSLAAAIEQWPSEGVPDKPGAWLMATAKHRAIDALRRRTMLKEKHAALEREAEIDLEVFSDADADKLDDEIGDDLLRLMFIACHPLLATEARVALTLRLLGGLTTDEIARAFLVPEPTIAQRIVRAKRTLGDARVPFELPPNAELGERLASVLEVIYLVFNEGYSATPGEDWMRPGLCEEALRLGRILTDLPPREPAA